jgi:trans-aconitate methyltransferase
MPKLYDELASWWPLLSAPADYAEEADFFRHLLMESCAPPPRTLVEFGSGGGNTASHLKAHFQITLVDLSLQMPAVSRALNPECKHFAGDMRAVRLGRRFDAVFIHDAIMYMTTEPGLNRKLSRRLMDVNYSLQISRVISSFLNSC